MAGDLTSFMDSGKLPRSSLAFDAGLSLLKFTQTRVICVIER